MIRIMLGKMGSGKTASMVREIVNNDDKKTTYSNIIMKKKTDHVITISRDMIIQKELQHTTKTGKEIYALKLNDAYWKDLSKKKIGINVVLDEAHTLLNSRRAMSKENEILNDFMSLLRRILGDSGDGYGELILISQLGRRLDINARELCTSVHYHVCHYIKTCKKCSLSIRENNEQLIKTKRCPKCQDHRFRLHDFIIEKFEFQNMDDCDFWLETRRKTYFRHYYITDIEKYFSYYDTFQWENLISDY